MYEPLVGQGDTDDMSCDAATTKQQQKTLRALAAAALLALSCGLLGLCSVMLQPRAGRQMADAEILAASPKSGPNSSTPASDDKASLIILRHCARGMVASVKDPASKYTRLDDYSSEPWSKLGEGDECLPRGADIIEAQGKFLKSHGNLPLPLRVTADTYPRNKVTMVRFLEGLQLQSESQFFHDLFVQAFGAQCMLDFELKEGTEAVVKNATEHLQANPPPAEYQLNVQKLYEVMGNGTAGDWTGDSCSITGIGLTSYPVGACQVAAQATEYMLMQWAGGQEFAWGHMNAAELEKLLVLHSWWFYNWWGPVDVYKFFGASMARELATKVSERSTGTDLYVGHDSNIMMVKGALGLLWEPDPFPANATIPGCMLRFDRTADMISASFWYPKTYSDTKGEMLSVPATFASTGSNQISASTFEHLLKHGSMEACATIPPRKAEIKEAPKKKESSFDQLSFVAGGVGFVLFVVIWNKFCGPGAQRR